MKTLMHTTSYLRSRSVLTIFPALFFLHCPRLSYSQCAPAPIAAAACSGGNGAATSGTNINSGNTYWFSGGPSTFTGINLSGGTFRVCGTLILSSMNFNGGNLIVESGGNLTINATMNVSGATIINRGTLTINGDLTLQGSNNYIYNDLSTSVLTFAGSGEGILTLNGTTSYVINRGMITAKTLLIQGTTGAVCMQDNSILSLTELDNDYTNSISYSGSGTPACLNVSTTAALNNDVANSSLIHVCTSATPSGGASSDASHGWGSATVYTGCSSCATVLALNFLSFTATRQGGSIALQWITDAYLTGNEIFYIEKSTDGINFSTLTSVEARTNQNAYAATDAVLNSSEQYYRIRATSPSGVNSYSAIKAVETGIDEPLRVYPNPAGPDQVITLVIHSPAATTAALSLVNIAGQIVSKRPVALVAGNNELSWDLKGIAAGIYFVRVISPVNGALYGRIAITGSPRN